MRKALSFLIFSAFLLFPLPAGAEESVPPPRQDWPHKSLLGTYDREAMRRGYQVYREVCSLCHTMKFVSYRNLADIGFPPEDVKEIAAQYAVTDGPDDDGKMFERPALPSNAFMPPFKNEKIARAANNGALPPDMSLLVRSREGGEDYIYGILTGFVPPPSGMQAQPGVSYNRYFAGGQIAMPPPLPDGSGQSARDVVRFLAWVSDPHMEQRKRTGVKVILFLLVFAGVTFKIKQRVWSEAGKENSH
ncbi:MAG: cytochrome c1 [Pseudomonadota bacterium]